MRENAFTAGHRALVSKAKATSDLRETIERAVKLLGGFEQVISSGDRVVVKPNFNSAHPFPATSDPEFVKVVVSLLYDSGASEVAIVESTGFPWPSTRAIFEKTGMVEAAEECGAKLKPLDDGEWVEVDIGGPRLKRAWMARDVLDGSKLVWLPCMKTHRWARFSLSLKLAVGLMRHRERVTCLHMGGLEEKIAELNLAVRPDIVIMDARRCMVTGGPNRGVVREPSLILASGDRVAIDVEALKILQSYGERNRLNRPPWELPQIRHAVELGLGVEGEDEIKRVQ